MGQHRMSSADAAWLGVDVPHNRITVTGVLRFAAPADWERLRDVVAVRLVGRFPTFSRRPVRSRLPFGRPVWDDDPRFDLDAHLVRVTLPRSDLRAYVGGLLGDDFDLTRSPWELHLVDHPADDDGPASSAVVARLHHAIADGIALATVLLSLTDDGPDAPVDDGGGLPGPSVLAGRDRPPSAATSVPPPPSGLRFAASVVATAVRLLTLPRDPRTRLRGRPGTTKHAAWAPHVRLDDVKAVARALDASVNDVLLAATAGAVRRHLLAHGEPAHDVRVFVPVNLRPVDVPVPRTLGNRFGLVLVRLPVSVPDAAARVRAVRDDVDRARARSEAGATFALVSLLGVLPRPVQRLVLAVLGAKTTAIVTNVPGPRTPVWFAGRRIEDLVFWVPQAASVGLGVSLFSYAGQVLVGVAADAGIVPDPQAVADDVVGELAALGATRTPGPVPRAGHGPSTPTARRPGSSTRA